MPVLFLISVLTNISYEWPKNDAPSGFTMKLRKHINNKRLEKLAMIGNDRVIDLQFGTGDAAQHLIVELYDKGNLILTDKDLTIINVLRPRVQGEEKFLVRETYSFDQAKAHFYLYFKFMDCKLFE